MNTFTLDDLIQDLQKSAEANEADKGDGKDKDKDGKDKDGKDGKSMPPFMKSEDKDKEKTDQEKSAAFKEGADIARQVMEKFASKNTQTDKGTNEMNKQAEAAGKALAQALMNKQAGVDDVSTYNGIPGGVVPNKAQADNAAMKAQHDMVIQNTPGTDGRGEGGTVNEIYDAIVADAMAQGVKDLQATGNTAQAEGAPNARQAPAQVPVAGPEDLGENQEKLAAVVALMEGGYDFDDATSLVKAASDQLDSEHDTQVKQAALNEMLNAGVDYGYAVYLVKSAGKMDAIKGAVGKMVGKAGDAYGTAHAYGKAGLETIKATGSNIAQHGREAATQAQTLGYMVRDHAKANPMAYKIGAGVAGAAAIGGGTAMAMSHKKQAAVRGLIDAGLDFDTATSLVDAKSQEMFGA